MFTNENLLRLGGIVQLSILIASALVPRMLDWRTELAGLKPFLRRLFWVYGAFIVLTILAMCILSIAFAGEIAASRGLGRGFAAFVLVFWAARLFVLFFVFDAGSLLRTKMMRIGYHALTVAFFVLIAAYGLVVLGGNSSAA